MGNNTITLTRKVTLYPVGDKEEVDRVYKYIRDGRYAQNAAYNIMIASLYSAMKTGNANEIKTIRERGQRTPDKDNPDYSLYEYGKINFATGLGTPSSVGQMAYSDFISAKNSGLFRGESRLPYLHLDSPLEIQPRFIKFFYKEDSLEDFKKTLYDNDCEVFLKFVNNITFKVVFGNPNKSHEMREVFEKIFDGVYKVRGSKITIEGKKIILCLSLAIPKQTTELKDDIVLGVDLGIAVPAYCAVNVNDYERKAIGTKEDFLRVRTKIQAQRRRLQKSLKYTSGGHGRKKKLQPLDRFEGYEKHWVENYNHFVSKQVVDAAIAAQARHIHIEDLTGFGEDEKKKFILRNWSYFQLQQFITYKAEKYGIIVDKVNPCYTSQVCSCCGHWEEGQRVSQSEFICKNPECNNYNKTVNADYNAARNIAKINDLSGEKEDREKLKKRAMTRIENGEWFS